MSVESSLDTTYHNIHIIWSYLPAIVTTKHQMLIASKLSTVNTFPPS